MLDVANLEELERFTRSAPSVCVTVSDTKGSTPRIAGTVMLVSANKTLGTIGGGQLEFMAIDAARAMLVSGSPAESLSVPLGPEIGQCCGGRVVLSLRALTDAYASELKEQTKELLASGPHVLIFGAGHVGRALASAMSPLPVNASLIDNRQEELELADPTVSLTASILPESLIRQAPPGSAYIILTHDHALDFLLAREALERTDAAYIGMIGSKTKRATFASWHAKEIGTDGSIDRLTMPIGGNRSRDKRPTVIAAFVAAEVMEAVSLWQDVQVPA
ncbi:MAG: xanthine dehydrogenase accessory protein XdhC [Pseudomonadota bacterium]